MIKAIWKIKASTKNNRFMNNTIDPKEIEKFEAMADEWWSATGKFKPLHKFNPCRIAYIKDTLIKHFSLDSSPDFSLATPLKNLKILFCAVAVNDVVIVLRGRVNAQSLNQLAF